MTGRQNADRGGHGVRRPQPAPARASASPPIAVANIRTDVVPDVAPHLMGRSRPPARVWAGLTQARPGPRGTSSTRPP
jgi:hypothetical protein